jgi:hypothetical protein
MTRLLLENGYNVMGKKKKLLIQKDVHFGLIENIKPLLLKKIKIIKPFLKKILTKY